MNRIEFDLAAQLFQNIHGIKSWVRSLQSLGLSDVIGRIIVLASFKQASHQHWTKQLTSLRQVFGIIRTAILIEHSSKVYFGMAEHSNTEKEDITSGLDRLKLHAESQETVGSEPNSAEAGPSNQATIGENAAQHVQPPQTAQVPARDLGYLKNPQKSSDVYHQSPGCMGIGGSGMVYKIRDRSTGIYYAIKMMDLWNLTDDKEAIEAKIMNEIDILSSLDHENVLRMKEYFVENNKIKIVTELLSGEDIVNAVLRRDPYTEADAQLLFFKLFSAIKYLHDNDVVHRDLKPENILLQNSQNFASVKIIDFGAAKKNEAPSTPVGTANYISPEVIRRLLGHETGPYTRATDLWSAGVVMFLLLDGIHPFRKDNLNDKGCKKHRTLHEAILDGGFSFDNSAWNTVSDSAKDLVSELLNQDPQTRITAAEALAHPWFTERPRALPMTRTKDKLTTLKAIPVSGRRKVWSRWSSFPRIPRHSFY